MEAVDQTAAPPTRFGIEFLDWFRATTERNWAAWQTRYFEGTEFAPFGSAPWQQQARWLDGLSDDTIDTLEHTRSVRFPPDWRLVLRRLHAPDRPPGWSLTQSAGLPYVQRPFVNAFGFYNWLSDVQVLRYYFQWPLDGLLFDVEHNDLWHDSWGKRYPHLDDRKKRLTDLVALAPKLIPVVGHRFLLAEPCSAGNPVLSIYQSDMVVYGADLHRYLINEFTYFLGLSSGETVPEETHASSRTIPFWGEFL